MFLPDLRNSTKKRCSLRVKVDRKKKGIVTPEVDSISDPEEEMHQASVLIQSILRGRAAQKLVIFHYIFLLKKFLLHFYRFITAEPVAEN